jgi:hypothetical protein
MMPDLENEKECCQYFIDNIYRGIISCPKCGSNKNETFNQNYKFRRCKNCHYEFSILTKTHLAHTNLHLKTWYKAILYFINSSILVTVTELQTALNIGNYKTSLNIAKLIRKYLLASNDNKITGEVFLDCKIYGKDNQILLIAVRKSSLGDILFIENLSKNLKKTYTHTLLEKIDQKNSLIVISEGLNRELKKIGYSNNLFQFSVSNKVFNSVNYQGLSLYIDAFLIKKIKKIKKRASLEELISEFVFLINKKGKNKEMIFKELLNKLLIINN